VQHLHPARHRALNTFHPAAADEEAALEPKHGLATLPVNGRADDEEPIRVARARVPGGIAAANNNLGRRLLDNFEVVRELGSRLVCGSSQLINRPQLGGGRRPLVFTGKVCSLKPVA
jgi:hypothetical protein